MKKAELTLVCFLLGIHVAVAQQDTELFTFKYGISPVSQDGQKEVLRFLELSIKAPVIVKEKNQLLAGIGYDNLSTQDSSMLGSKALKGLSGLILFNRKMTEVNSLQLFFSGGLFSDFLDISGEDIRVTAGMRYKTRLNENFTISAALIYSKQFFGTLIAPSIDFHWKISERLSLLGPVPVNPKLRYIVNSNMKLSFFLKPENTTYRLSEERNSKYFQKKQWNAGIGLEYLIHNHWMISFQTGASLKQQFEIYEASENGTFSILTIDVGGKERTPTYSYKQNTFFTNVTLSWVIKERE